MANLGELSMRKTLIALAVLGMSAGFAHAQSNVTIYGVVDTGYVKQTGRDLRMGANEDNRLGFRGTEDLGGGLKATFQLERRFEVYDGTLGNKGQPTYRYHQGDSSPDWGGQTTIGLSGDWGAVRLGRINELTTETIRRFDPFNQFSVGSMIYSTQRTARIDNTIRYDSPKWSGFSFGATYSLGANAKNENTGGRDHDGYGINLSYGNGPLSLTGNWSRVADSDKSYVWNMAGAYKFGAVKLSLLYEKTNDKGFRARYTSGRNWGLESGPDAISTKGKTDNWLLGLTADVGPGQLGASVSYFRIKNEAINTRDLVSADKSRNNMKYALGYTYNLSKRTSVYAIASYTDYKSENVGLFYTGLKRESVTGMQVGMTHKF